MLILGIESSCDETAVAIYDSGKGLLGHELFSQVELHLKFGGVVPELASRDHIVRLLPLLSTLLASTGVSLDQIGGVAYTKGPGLVGALLVGATFGRTLAWALDVPAIGVHHIEAHLLAAMLESNPPAYPFLALIVSGGHTLLMEVRDLGDYQLLGESLDDAAGEAFDKSAKLLGLPYPGGPEISALARRGNPERFHFPRPMLGQPGLNFSFSGLKTAVMQEVRKYDLDDTPKADLAASFQAAVVEVLAMKCRRALRETKLDCLVVSGGVAANTALRESLNLMCIKEGVDVFYPRQAFCTDNAAMVAFAGCQRLMRGEKEDLVVDVFPRGGLA